MKISEREEQILNIIVQEYIKSAQPISSQLIEKKHNFGICPASIRIEMKKLTEEGYLFQPHTSAGRVPTDKGYRYFVDELLEKGFSEEHFGIEDWLEEEFDDTFKFIQTLTKNLASLSSSLALGYLCDEKILWKEGWEELLKEPEFKEAKFISNFVEIVKELEERIVEFEERGTKIYIGKENPFFRVGEFGTIISRCHFPKKEEGILALLGPKRMAYDKNINLINSLTRILENF